jgi:hypothetical protein
MLPTLNWGRIVAVFVLLTALAAGVWKIYHTGVVEGRAEVQAQWTMAKLAQGESDARAESDMRMREQNMQTAADNLRRTKDAQITKLNRDHAAALDGLRDRPTHPEPGAVPSDSGAGPSCYPSQLYREDASVAIEFATEADQLRIHLGRCQDAYESVRKSLNGPK